MSTYANVPGGVKRVTPGFHAVRSGQRLFQWMPQLSLAGSVYIHKNVIDRDDCHHVELPRLRVVQVPRDVCGRTARRVGGRHADNEHVVHLLSLLGQILEEGVSNWSSGISHYRRIWGMVAIATRLPA